MTTSRPTDRTNRLVARWVKAAKAAERANALAARLAVASEVAREAARNASDALSGAQLLLRWAEQGCLAAHNALCAAEAEYAGSSTQEAADAAYHASRTDA